jgi:hypothetical protein
MAHFGPKNEDLCPEPTVITFQKDKGSRIKDKGTTLGQFDNQCLMGDMVSE